MRGEPLLRLGGRRDICGMGRQRGLRIVDERLMVHERVAFRGAGGLVGGQVLVLLQRPELGILLERLPLLRRSCRKRGFRFSGGLIRRRLFSRRLRSPPDRSERFAFGALDFGWIGAAAALEVEMLADRVVKYAHAS